MTLLQSNLQKLQNDKYEKMKTLLTTVCSSVMIDKMTTKNDLNQWQSILAKKVRTFREDLEWTQEDLAKKASLTKSYVGNIELMKRPRISAESVIKLAVALNVNTDALLKE